MTSTHNDAIARALRVAEQGLKSMQALQLQTADAHQKFLETQAAAARALQEMIAGARKLSSPGSSCITEPAVCNASPPPAMEAHPDVQYPEKATAPTPPPSAPESARPVKTHETEPRTGHLSKTLLSVVSRLTGYPEEMLGMDMDIESDLGIDSIKRVEILSAMEEAIPGLPAVSPDIMGSLKTLGQIVEHFDGAPAAATAPSNLPSPEPDRNPSSDASNEIGKEIEGTLLSVVSRLTGYPEEMLGMDMDIESDLGIDSIKRVEILSAMEEAIPGLPAVSPDMMGSLKTLRLIIEYLSGVSPSSDSKEVPLKPEVTQETAAPASVQRYRVTPVTTSPKATVDKALSLYGVVYITDDGTGLSEALAQSFKNRGIQADQLAWDDVSCIRSGQRSLTDTCGLVLIPKSSAFSTDGSAPQDLEPLKDAFFLARNAGPHLINAGKSGDALFATVTRLDGAFGFKDAHITGPVSGALAGLAKTAALEWETVRCRALDVSPDWKAPAEVADRIAIELLDAGADDAVEIGIDKDARTILSLSIAPLTDNDLSGFDLTSGDVVLVSGGARGVTAETALALARSARPTLVLLGRSPEPFAEPEWLKPLATEREIKAAIIEHEFQNEKATPRVVEAAFRRYWANREITKNIEKMTAFGARVRYTSIDIRNLPEVTDLLESVRREYGPIQGILHGAGVLEDKLILDKSDAQFQRVLETKLMGLQVLLAATAQDPLKYLILFSSVAARFGNAGQADYAMANEALNKIARFRETAYPDRKTVAINWGPWDGGMVTEPLKQEFARKHIDLIPLETGAEYLVKEMATTDETGEIIFGAPLNHRETDNILQRVTKESDPPSENSETLRVMLNRDIDIRQFPVLTSHQLDGTPVVPFALLTEWIGHSALHDNPGLLLHRVEDMRLLKGIRMDEDRKTIRLLAGKAKKKENSSYEVDVEIRNGIQDVKEVLHSKARTLLSTRLPDPPEYDYGRISSLPPYGKSIEEVYENILFHGHALHGIRKIIGLSEEGMAAEVAPAPSPERWMERPMRSRWIADPLVLDSAFQMACVWCYEQKGMVSLPSFVASFRQYCRKFPDTPVTAILEVRHVTDHKMIGDVTILDTNQKVAAELKGYEAIMDGSLFKAFKPELARSA